MQPHGENVVPWYGRGLDLVFCVYHCLPVPMERKELLSLVMFPTDTYLAWDTV